MGAAITWLRLPVAALLMLLLWAVMYYGLPDVKQKFLAQGVEPTTNSPEEFRKLVADESARWKALIESSGIKLE